MALTALKTFDNVAGRCTVLLSPAIIDVDKLISCILRVFYYIRGLDINSKDIPEDPGTSLAELSVRAGPHQCYTALYSVNINEKVLFTIPGTHSMLILSDDVIW